MTLAIAGTGLKRVGNRKPLRDEWRVAGRNDVQHVATNRQTIKTIVAVGIRPGPKILFGKPFIGRVVEMSLLPHENAGDGLLRRGVYDLPFDGSRRSQNPRKLAWVKQVGMAQPLNDIPAS